MIFINAVGKEDVVGGDAGGGSSMRTLTIGKSALEICP
jgi:hypothetical protein